MSSPNVPTRNLGKNGPEVTAMGFGLMGLSAFYGPKKPDEERFALLDHIYESGERFWDSSDIYGDSEELVGRWFAKNPGKRESVFLATKFGISVDPKTGARNIRNDPEYIEQCVEKSLKRLQTDYIDLYYIHRVQRDQPIEIAIEALKKLKQQGKIRHIGMSETSADTLRRACKVEHVDAFQIEYSPFTMDIEHADTPLLKACRETGTAVVCYSPLGRGFLTGRYRSPDDFEEDDFRKFSPRFSPENFHKNLELVDTIKAIADKKGVTAGQLVLAFLMAQGDDIIPIPGTTRISNFDENMAAFKVKLSPDEEAEIRKAIDNAEVHGGRYPATSSSALFADTVPLK